MPARNHHQLVFPGDVRWDDARQAWNLAADLRPAVVALPSPWRTSSPPSTYAVERDLRVVVQGTGHGASVHASLEGAMLSTCAGCAASRSTPQQPPRPGRGRRLLGGRRRPGHRAGPDGAARVVAERRRRRLLARRRDRLAGPQARPLGRERPRDRARHRGRCRSCAPTGRRTRTSSGRCAAAAAASA